jgi:hypothetical protein
MKGHLNDKKKTIYLRYNKSFLKRKLEFNFGVRVMVFNATFNNISFNVTVTSIRRQPRHVFDNSADFIV